MSLVPIDALIYIIYPSAKIDLSVLTAGIIIEFEPAKGATMKVNRFQIMLAGAIMMGSALAAELMVPRVLMARTLGTFNLETVIPKQFGEWTQVPNIRVVEPPGSMAYEIYNQELGRGYVDKDGNLVMLLIAYGQSQSAGLQLHNPEICYAAQGFRVTRPTVAKLAYDEKLPEIGMRRLITQREARFEPVTYWMRIGHDVPYALLERQVVKFKYGLRGFIPDGTLVRVSTIGLAEGPAFELQNKFIKDLINAADVNTRKVLVGDPAQAVNL